MQMPGLLLLISSRVAQSLSATATERAGVMPERPVACVFHCQLTIHVLVVTRLHVNS